MLQHVVDLLVVGDHVEVSLVSCEHVVEFGDELLDGWDKLDKSLWYKYYTIVHAACGTVGNGVGDVSHHVVERLVLSLYLLTDECDVWMSLQCALECDV